MICNHSTPVLRRPGCSAYAPRPGWLAHLVAFATQELRETHMGSAAVKLRMAELLFVDVIRRYLETLADGQVGWLAGLRNPVVSRTLALLHDAPTRNWTWRRLQRRSDHRVRQ